MRRFIKEIYPYIVIIILVFLIKKFLVAPVRVIGPSMKDTLLNGDIMILNKINYRINPIRRFDIVVIKYEKDLIIKRIIGLPGDKVEHKDNKLYINDVYYEEHFLSTGTTTTPFTTKSISGFDVIPENCYLVLGDNREESKDSRIIGLINKKDIEGRASIIVFPFNRIGNKQYK